jgi:hypothetical protein
MLVEYKVTRNSNFVLGAKTSMAKLCFCAQSNSTYLIGAIAQCARTERKKHGLVFSGQERKHFNSGEVWCES